MKKIYKKLEMEIIEFDTEDVITTSTGQDGNEDNDDGTLTNTGV